MAMVDRLLPSALTPEDRTARERPATVYTRKLSIGIVRR